MLECGAFGLQPDEAAHEVATVIEAVNIWRSDFVHIGVKASDIERLAAFIDGDVLLEQLRGFPPAQFTKAGGESSRWVRRGPLSGELR